MDNLPVPLYHGTSSLFLSRIIEQGLGGDNPISKWRVLECAKRLWPLIQKNFANEDDWMLQVQSFGWMCEQRSSNFNFQHGQTYLSPAEATAIRYATDKRYGSELLTYTLEFLAELIRRSALERSREFTEEFSQITSLLGRSFAPILIEVANVPAGSLLDEGGNSPSRNIELMKDTLATHDPQIAQLLLQQTNFRLAEPVLLAHTSFWLLDTGTGCEAARDVSKHLIYVHGSRNGGLGSE